MRTSFGDNHQIILSGPLRTDKIQRNGQAGTCFSRLVGIRDAHHGSFRSLVNLPLGARGPIGQRFASVPGSRLAVGYFFSKLLLRSTVSPVAAPICCLLAYDHRLRSHAYPAPPSWKLRVNSAPRGSRGRPWGPSVRPRGGSPSGNSPRGSNNSRPGARGSSPLLVRQDRIDSPRLFEVIPPPVFSNGNGFVGTSRVHDGFRGYRWVRSGTAIEGSQNAPESISRDPDDHGSGSPSRFVCSCQGSGGRGMHDGR